MEANKIRQKYLNFFKKQGHAIIQSASLLPENDSSSLYIGSGMQPLIPYLLGEKHPSGKRLVNIQKCFRAEDIEEIGDNRHTTCFEMMGNWSLGDYFKQEQLNWFWEFLTKELKLDPHRLYVSAFRGNKEIGIDKDEESVAIWQEIYKMHDIDAKVVDFPERDGMQAGRIFYYDEKETWWSRSGMPGEMPVGEIGGPDSEVFYDLGADLKRHENSPWRDQACHVNCDCGRFSEIGNSVFIEFIKTKTGFEPLPQKNVDFGGGLERLTMVSEGLNNIYETDLYINTIKTIQKLSGKKYQDNARAFEIIADHLKAATFIMSDDQGVRPSNVGADYLVRRLIRRAIRFGFVLGITQGPWTKEIAKIVAHDYQEIYPELQQNIDKVIEELNKEEAKFKKTLIRGEKMIKGKVIDGEMAFNLFQTHGYPREMTEEIAQEKGIKLSSNFSIEFEQAMKKHQDLSRDVSGDKFKGGLADTSEQTTKLHTAAHLLLVALRQVLGDHVFQKGSNITAQRLRFDFSHGEKLTAGQIKQAEDLVNQAIQDKLDINCQEMNLAKAKEQKAMGVFGSKYDNMVKVYRVGQAENPVSIEICGGPHVKNTGILGHFKITKEQSSSAGVRRIKAILK